MREIAFFVCNFGRNYRHVWAFQRHPDTVTREGHMDSQAARQLDTVTGKKGVSFCDTCCLNATAMVLCVCVCVCVCVCHFPERAHVMTCI